MKRSTLTLLLFLITLSMKAQEQKNELIVGVEKLNFTTLDTQASPLIYEAKATGIQLNYMHRAEKSRFSLQVAPAIGTSLPHRYGSRTYGDDFYSYEVASTYYALSLQASYLRGLDSKSDRVQYFIGASVYDHLAIADEIANFYWAMNQLTANLQGAIEWTPRQRHRFAVGVSVPAIGVVTRHIYANFPKSTDDSNFAAFFKQGSRLATINRLQRLDAEVSYQFKVSKRLNLGAAYKFGWFHYSLPRPIRAYSQAIALQSGFSF